MLKNTFRHNVPHRGRSRAPRTQLTPRNPSRNGPYISLRPSARTPTTTDPHDTMGHFRAPDAVHLDAAGKASETYR